MSAAPNPPDLSRLRIAEAERTPPVQPKRLLPIVAAAVTAAVVAGGAGWLLRGPASPPIADAPPPANAVPVVPSAAPGAILAGGRVESSERRELAFAQAGVVGVVNVARGQVVKAGEVLVELDAANERADVAEKRAALDAAQARLAELTEGARPEELEQAQRDVDAAVAVAKDAEDKAAQAQLLVSKGAFSKSEAAEAAHTADAARARAASAQARLALVTRGARKTSLSTAQAEVSRVRAAVAQSEARLAQTRLVAPVDGTVVEVRVKSGEATGAAAQALAAVVLTDLAHLEVKVDVPEAKAALVKRGMPAAITVEALAETRFRGRVTDVGLEADRQKGTLEVTVAFDERSPLDGVRPRMAARVSIDVNAPNAPNAPNAETEQHR